MKDKFILNSYQALGTLWWIEFFDNLNQKEINEVSEKLKKEIFAFEQNYSRFKIDSELNTLNLNRELNNPSEDLILMINKGFEVAEISNNIFNLCVGGILEKRGYGNIFLNKNLLKEELVPMREILSVQPDKISLTKDGYNLDLGGIGKGYLIDKIKNILLKFNIKYFLINAGGDIYATSNFSEPIDIYLEDPLNKNLYLGFVKLKDESLCSSSSFKRSWEINSKKYNHFVSYKNIKDYFSSFVISKNSVDADTLATCFCIEPSSLQNINNLVKSYLVLNNRNEVEFSYNFKIYE